MACVKGQVKVGITILGILLGHHWDKYMVFMTISFMIV